MKDYGRLIRKKDVPAHVAIIMDGNGRWAKKRSLPRSEGHRRGAEIIEPLMDAAIVLGIKAVSLYAFSTENWLRPPSEVTGLWRLLEYFFREKIDIINGKGIRVKHSGFREKLPASTRRTIQEAVEKTGRNRGLVLNFCVNYGGRQEIVHAVNEWAGKRGNGERLTPEKLEKHLFTSDLPPVDLLIRTAGEFRTSNFMVWQGAYAELVFMKVLWPDFRVRHLHRAIYEYQQRERRFGAL
ncbi:MAG: di-trans,poly-cis-decaprenylcistransferase [Spirochaetes bacterium]|nr:di-trans,poly-cis-decaprenylcistransferase [Spirochaetota bacterium]